MVATPLPEHAVGAHADPPAAGTSEARGARYRQNALPIAGLFAGLFVMALLPRLVGLGGAVTEDEDQWIARTGAFARALEGGDWQRTYQTGHPGVTVMWAVALTLGPERASAFGEAARGQVPVTAVPDFLSALHDARIPFAALNAGLAALVGVLAWRLVGAGAGLLGGLLLALDPYWSGVGPIVGMDGPLAGLLCASLLGLLLACRSLATRSAAPAERRGNIDRPEGEQQLAPSPPPYSGRITEGRSIPRRALGWAAPAGVLWGLALLTKTTALLLAPLVPLLLLAASLSLYRRRSQLDPAAARRNGLVAGITRAALLGLTWGGVGILVAVLLWPAAWGQPLGTLWRALDFSVRLGGTPHGPGNFFLGRPIDDPGPLFYPVALALRLGPGTSLGLMGLLLFGAPRRAGFVVWSLLGYVALFLLLLTLASKKVDRYLLPVLPALDILAGIGWWEAARRLATLRMTIPRGRSPTRIGLPIAPSVPLLATTLAAALAVVALQAWPLVAAGRYPLAAYNPLFGGARMAERSIPVGWGDGLDVAGARIRELSDGAPATTAIWSPLWVNFQAHAPGPVVTERRLADADFYVDYVHARQRRLTPRELVGRQPDAVVRIAGVDYARVYRLR